MAGISPATCTHTGSALAPRTISSSAAIVGDAIGPYSSGGLNTAFQLASNFSVNTSCATPTPTCTGLAAASNILVKPIFAYSMTGGYVHWWLPNLRTQIAAGNWSQAVPSQLIGPTESNSANKQLWNAFVTLVWNPVAFITTGVEYMYGRRFVVSNAHGPRNKRSSTSGAWLSNQEPLGFRRTASWSADLHPDEQPMIELIEDLPRNVVGISVRGRVTKQECHEILTPAVRESLKWREKSRLYYELGSRFPGAGWDDLDLGFEHASRCERIAIVTDIAWVKLTVKAIRFLIPGEIRVFTTIEAPRGARLDHRPSRIPGRRRRCCTGSGTLHPITARAPAAAGAKAPDRREKTAE